jgi:hypothetical protein
MAWDRYVAPFSYGLWLAVATAACVLSVCLAVTSFSHKSNQSFSLIATLFYIPACLCQQGQNVNILYEIMPLVFVIYIVVLLFFFLGYS